MTRSSSSLAPTHLGSKKTWPLLGILIPSLGLLIVLTLARSTLDFLDRGNVTLAITCDLRTQR